ncbi:hypothetical protein HHI36_021730 [Cryptolaemus montrouzieri]|uniref:THAP-type domain-containing protein n=1 Tax=Cryptolaemus montrouzieri TaxID=559131 RepID=A0ABD2MXS2_9CUCU
MGGSRKCLFCGRPQNASENISLHQFPHINEIKMKWLSVCKLQASDNVTNLRICSKHFAPEDIVKDVHNVYKRVHLKSSAVPIKKRKLQDGYEHDYTKGPVVAEKTSDIAVKTSTCKAIKVKESIEVKIENEDYRITASDTEFLECGTRVPKQEPDEFRTERTLGVESTYGGISTIFQTLT